MNWILNNTKSVLRFFVLLENGQYEMRTSLFAQKTLVQQRVTFFNTCMCWR